MIWDTVFLLAKFKIHQTRQNVFVFVDPNNNFENWQMRQFLRQIFFETRTNFLQGGAGLVDLLVDLVLLLDTCNIFSYSFSYSFGKTLAKLCLFYFPKKLLFIYNFFLALRAWELSVNWGKLSFLEVLIKFDF